MKSLKMKLIYRKHKKAILGTLGAVLLAGLVFFFSYFHVTKVEVMGTSRYTDEQVKEMALQGAFTDNSVLAVLLHSSHVRWRQVQNPSHGNHIYEGLRPDTESWCN